MRKYVLEIWKIGADGDPACDDPFLVLSFECVPSHVEHIVNQARLLAWEYRPVADCIGYSCFIYDDSSPGGYSRYMHVDEAVAHFKVQY